MDLGAAAEGIAAAILALILMATLAVHFVGVVLCTIGLFARRTAARILVVAALAVVSANHAVLLYIRAWRELILDPLTDIVWVVILAFMLSDIIAVASVIFMRKPSQGNQT